MNEIKKAETWFSRHIKAEAEKDVLPLSDRIGNVAAIIVTILVTLFFAAHQAWQTGFFTPKFGLIEASLFYGVLIYQIVPSALKALFGRKNLGRLFDLFGSIFGLVALIWLFMVFPFNFTYFADALPASLRFLVQWISNDIARIFMALGIVISPIMAAHSAI
ncbi:hypothetical protein H5T51_02815, partial [Candidatus Bathyarchaeota archaeon]|nr:hypothetical protein [Candidatus Bathyarchaeota archaeon]